MPGIELPFSAIENDHVHSWNQYVIRVKDITCFNEIEEDNRGQVRETISSDLPNSKARDWLKRSLEEKGVNTIIYYPIPIHLQPAYKELEVNSISLNNTERLCSQVLSLPIFPELTIEEQEHVVNSLRRRYLRLHLLLA